LLKSRKEIGWLPNCSVLIEKKKEIFYTSTQETPLERHLYKVNWNTFKTEKLTNQAGMHSGILSKDGNHLYDSYSNANSPRIVNVINTNTLKSKNLITSENTLKKLSKT
jgi:Dipeptidyl peptidase IV (DPP IV) N-terminal region.